MADSQFQQHREIIDMLAQIQRQLGRMRADIERMALAIQRMTASSQQPPERR